VSGIGTGSGRRGLLTWRRHHKRRIPGAQAIPGRFPGAPPAAPDGGRFLPRTLAFAGESR
jgi:hypothetical protein